MDHQTTPPLLINEAQLRQNLTCIWSVGQRTKARMLLHPPAFPAWPLYPMLAFYLSGTLADSAALAEIGLTKMDRDSHGILLPGAEEAGPDLLPLCHHITFTTLDQWQRLGASANSKGLTCALGLSPTQDCQPGISLSALPHPLPAGVTGLHLRLVPGADLAALERALDAVETACADLLPQLQQFSIGGTFPLTDPDFDLPRLENLLLRLRETYGLLLYLEVGDAVAQGVVTRLPHPPEFPFPFQEGYPPLYLQEGTRIRPFTHF